MTTIVTRSGKGSSLTNAEMDANLNNLNNDKLEGPASAVDGGLVAFNGTTGKLVKAASTATYTAKTSDTGSSALPSGTTAQRDGSPSAGYLRFNSTLTQFEGYNGTVWGAVGGGATGGAGNYVFYENDTNVTVDYTIPATKNAMTAGPITINTGITVTVSTGATWTVV